MKKEKETKGLEEEKEKNNKNETNLPASLTSRIPKKKKKKLVARNKRKTMKRKYLESPTERQDLKKKKKINKLT